MCNRGISWSSAPVKSRHIISFPNDGLYYRSISLYQSLLMWQIILVGCFFTNLQIKVCEFLRYQKRILSSQLISEIFCLLICFVYFTSKWLTGCVTFKSKEGTKYKTKQKKNQTNIYVYTWRFLFVNENGWRWRTRYYFHTAGGALLSAAGLWSDLLPGHQTLFQSPCRAWGPCHLEVVVPSRHVHASIHFPWHLVNLQDPCRCVACPDVRPLHHGSPVHALPLSSSPPRSGALHLWTWWAAGRGAMSLQEKTWLHIIHWLHTLVVLYQTLCEHS